MPYGMTLREIGWPIVNTYIGYSAGCMNRKIY